MEKGIKEPSGKLIKAHLKIVREMQEEIITLRKKVEELERAKDPPAPGSEGTPSGL